jgi:uncharacterized membrane protein
MTGNQASGSDRRRPLHPPLVHVPIGGVVIAAACDLVSGAGGASHDWARTWFKGATYALLVGTALLFLAAIAGFADRTRQTHARSPQRAAVDRHAAVMSLMGVACVADLILRTDHYGSAQHTPAVVLALTLAALLLATLGGELGGRLVYRYGIAVDAPAPPERAGARAVSERPARTGRRPSAAPATDTPEPPDTRATARRGRARLVTTLAAWLVAFLLVTALLSFFGQELNSLPLAPRALVMSGVLMTVMTTLVMPALSVAVARWLAGPAQRRGRGAGTVGELADGQPAGVVGHSVPPRREVRSNSARQGPDRAAGINRPSRTKDPSP